MAEKADKTSHRFKNLLVSIAVMFGMYLGMLALLIVFAVDPVTLLVIALVGLATIVVIFYILARAAKTIPVEMDCACTTAGKSK